MSDVAIVDTGGANLASIRHAVTRLGRSSELVDDPDQLSEARHVILLGVGAEGEAMRRLVARGMVDVLRRCDRPVLGICLGMQLLYERTEEDSTLCLGVVQGQVDRLRPATDRPVPHMGWARVEGVRPSRLLEGITDGEYFYFVHSFAAPETETTCGVSDHGGAFASVLERDNFFGTQFHPERSSAQGARLLDNFLSLS